MRLASVWHLHKIPLVLWGQELHSLYVAPFLFCSCAARPFWYHGAHFCSWLYASPINNSLVILQVVGYFLPYFFFHFIFLLFCLQLLEVYIQQYTCWYDKAWNLELRVMKNRAMEGPKLPELCLFGQIVLLLRCFPPSWKPTFTSRMLLRSRLIELYTKYWGVVK